MAGQATLEEQSFATSDISLLVSALLEGIRRGELEASQEEIDFLASILQLLR